LSNGGSDIQPLGYIPAPASFALVEAELREKIAGEVVLSPHPGRTLRKWREDFGISQRDLAKSLSTVPSVVSDYESERRASPGATFIRRYVQALMDVDTSTGGRVGQRMGVRPHSDGILGMREFAVAVPLKALADQLNARAVSRVDLHRDIHGFTLLDAPRAILAIDATRFVEVYGWTTQRALIFSNVKYGRSPMVAIRAHPLKPAAVVFSNPGRVDPLAVRLSEVENIPLLTTSMPAPEVLERLEEL
jgi:putative transcriptional regulator